MKKNLSFKNVIFYSLFGFLSYLLLYITCRQIFPAEIIFYQGLYIIFITSSAFFLFSYFRFRNLDLSALSALIIILAGYSFHITIPSLLDRSISLYILGLSNQNTPTSIQDYRQSFYSGFIENNQAVEKRMREQEKTGNLTCNKEGCLLTKKGQTTRDLNIFLVKIFNVDPRYVTPELPKK